jgi:hypothetical protein
MDLKKLGGMISRRPSSDSGTAKASDNKSTSRPMSPGGDTARVRQGSMAGLSSRTSTSASLDGETRSSMSTRHGLEKLSSKLGGLLSRRNSAPDLSRPEPQGDVLERAAVSTAPAPKRGLARALSMPIFPRRESTIGEKPQAAVSKRPTASIESPPVTDGAGNVLRPPRRLRIPLDKESVHIYFRSSAPEDHNLAGYLAHQKRFGQPLKFHETVGSGPAGNVAYGAHSERKKDLSSIDLAEFEIPHTTPEFTKILQDYVNDH